MRQFLADKLLGLIVFFSDLFETKKKKEARKKEEEKKRVKAKMERVRMNNLQHRMMLKNRGMSKKKR